MLTPRLAWNALGRGVSMAVNDGRKLRCLLRTLSQRKEAGRMIGIAGSEFTKSPSNAETLAGADRKRA